MKLKVGTSRNRTSARKRMTVLLLALCTIALGCRQPNITPLFNNSADPYQASRWSSAVFTPAHATFTDAAKHYLRIRPKPVQPIDFPHKVHTDDIGVNCAICHAGAAKGAVAGIPGVSTCIFCHQEVGDPNDARIIKIRDYAKRGEDFPWQRVYGFLEEAHVRFNHAPHVRAGVECSTCHGDLMSMTVAERVVDHTMGFCINCHKTKQASNDCLVCHY